MEYFTKPPFSGPYLYVGRQEVLHYIKFGIAGALGMKFLLFTPLRKTFSS